MTAASEPGDTITLTWSSLRVLLDSIREGDSIEEAMLAAEELAVAPEAS